MKYNTEMTINSVKVCMQDLRFSWSWRFRSWFSGLWQWEKMEAPWPSKTLVSYHINTVP